MAAASADIVLKNKTAAFKTAVFKSFIIFSKKPPPLQVGRMSLF